MPIIEIVGNARGQDSIEAFQFRREFTAREEQNSFGAEIVGTSGGIESCVTISMRLSLLLSLVTKKVIDSNNQAAV